MNHLFLLSFVCSHFGMHKSKQIKPKQITNDMNQFDSVEFSSANEYILFNWMLLWASPKISLTSVYQRSKFLNVFSAGGLRLTKMKTKHHLYGRMLMFVISHGSHAHLFYFSFVTKRWKRSSHTNTDRIISLYLLCVFRKIMYTHWRC